VFFAASVEDSLVRALPLAVVLASACSGGGAVDAGVDAGPRPTCEDVFGDRKTQVCLRWKCDTRFMDEGTWSGDAGACVPGDLASEARDSALRLINLYRFLADLPAVETSPMRDQQAQACALMMHAANRLDTMPGPAWPCYTPGGAAAAGNSTLHLGPAVAAVTRSMHDPGNAMTLGRRRWLLAATLGPIGIGGTPSASCFWVTGGTTTAPKRFVTWPPSGPVPLAALTTTHADETGWSVQTFAAADDLAGATVAVTDDGADAPVDVTPLQNDYGGRYALAFKPRGWTARAGHEYVVNLVAPAISANPIVYSVQVVDCP
jgi:hypothetical protein